MQTGKNGLAIVCESFCTKMVFCIFENNQPTPMIVDFHYYVGSAHNQMVENNWKNFALNNSILMLWPDGYNDAPHGYR